VDDCCVTSTRVKANERQEKRKTTERACSFVTHQFGFHIVSHRSPHNMNNMVGDYDLFDKFHDYIDNLNKDQWKLKKKKKKSSIEYVLDLKN
jgi:hypothetical protein